MEEYKLLYEIGSGSYGKVFAASFREKLFAIKISYLDDSGALNSGIVREWIFAKSFTPSVHVCPILEKWYDHTRSFFVMPLYDCNLYDYMRESKRTFKEFQTIAAQIQTGVLQMHRQGWQHRDLKPDNIYMNRDGVVVGDFNLVRFQCNDSETSGSYGTSRVCTLWSRAPELVWAELQGKATIKAGPELDAFSFGIILLSLAKGDYVLGKHVEGAGNTKEVRYMNGVLSFLGVDEKIRMYYQLGDDQIFMDFRDAANSLYPLFPSSWSHMEKFQTAKILASLLDPLPTRRRLIQDCQFTNHDALDTSLCENLRLTGKIEGKYYGPGYPRDLVPATLGQLSLFWTISLSKDVPIPIAMHAIKACKRLPVFSCSTVQFINNMVHLVHRYKTFDEIVVNITARSFLNSIQIYPHLWKLCTDIEKDPFLCCILSAWISIRHDFPKDVDELSNSAITKSLLFHGEADLFFKKTRPMLESWRRLESTA